MSGATSNWWSIGPMPTGTATALSTTSTAATAFGKGRRYRQYIQSWLNGLPVSGEIQEDFNETVP